MILFIAEKPSLGRAIAENIDDTFTKEDGYLRGKNTLVTWCFGHILELYNPEDYDPNLKIWKKESLPILIKDWKLKASENTRDQLEVIKNLLSEAHEIVHAGDPDREGQLLVDEVLDYFHNTLPVQRIWLASLDSRSVKNALNSLKDNAEYKNLSHSALARSRADWTIGLNATRAMTILGKEAGYSNVLSQGRVQTPTLNLVVTRDREIKNFVAKNYFTIDAFFSPKDTKDLTFKARFTPDKDCLALDSEDRLIDEKFVKELVFKKYESIQISSITKTEKKQSPPLPHSLSSLQMQASKDFSMSAKEVLDIAQSLYEKKLTSYPRSDCQFLPEEQFDDVICIMPALEFVPKLEKILKNVNLKLKSKAWDTSKVTAHHAIIPTGEVPSSPLSEKELIIYTLITENYCLQFYPDYIYEAQNIDILMDNTLWKARGKRIIELGWREIQVEEGEENKNAQALPELQKDTSLLCTEIKYEAKKTSPPPYFTEGKLIEAMANIHRFIEDSEAKSVLKENEGLGTEATRANILETLKKRSFLKIDGKHLKSTELGQKLIELTPQALKDPVTTAQWESRLTSIEKGHESLEDFMQAQEEALPSILSRLLSGEASFPPLYPCPECGKAIIRKSNKNKEFFWSCSAYPTCKHSQPDQDGKPGVKKVSNVSTEFLCKECGKGLIRHKGKKGFFWGCSGFRDGCKSTYFDKNNQPEYK